MISINEQNNVSITKLTKIRNQYNLFNSIISAIIKFKESSIIILMVL